MLKEPVFFILAGGPSLKGQELRELRGKNVIALKTSIYFWPWAPFCYFHDYSWYVDHSTNLRKFENTRFICAFDNVIDDPAVETWQVGDNYALDDRPGYLPKGNNSGYGGGMLAWKFGAATIVLLGYDMRVVDGQHRFHNLRNWTPSDSIYESEYIPNMERFGRYMQEAGVKVINATPGSALKCFEMVEDYRALV